MKNKLSLFFTFFLVIPVVLLSGFSWWKWAISPVDAQDRKEEIFVIPKGESTDQIIRRLHFEGFIKSPLAFKVILKKEGLAGKIQAGDFRLSRSMNARETAMQLTHGTLDVWISIPEGLRNEEIFEILKKEGFDFEFSFWQKETEDKEGLLFPDTYLVPKEATPSTVVKIMIDNFGKKTKDFGKILDKEKLTLASLIEREVKFDQDRPIVSGILTRRLKQGWPLEVDATIQYALANVKCLPAEASAQAGQMSNVKCNSWWPKVTAEDLKIVSEYNTYQNIGLPPAPICNPGLASLKAAIFPQETEYWFYLSDKKGNMHYAKDLEEHEENIEKYLE